MPMATPAEVRKRQEEYLRMAEERQRRNGVPPFKNGAEALEAFGDLFDSDEEAEEFADLIDQMREEERARYRH
jgi:hypothetical protein